MLELVFFVGQAKKIVVLFWGTFEILITLITFFWWSDEQKIAILSLFFFFTAFARWYKLIVNSFLWVDTIK